MSSIYLCMNEMSRRRTWLSVRPRMDVKVCVRIDQREFLEAIEAKSTNLIKIYAGSARTLFAYIDDNRVSGRETKIGAMAPLWDVEWETLRAPLLKQFKALTR